MKKRHGFTLIELVIVIGIIGLLAAIAIPKFADLTGLAKVGATKAGLGSVRSTLAVMYANSATAGGTASYPTSMTVTSFAGGELPRNAINGSSGVTDLSVTVDGTATADIGFWFITSSTSSIWGKSGAYSDGSTIAAFNTVNY